MLKAQNISRRFGAMFALQDVSFTVRSGEILGLIGPNGAGKTTLLEILSGMLPADSGSVLWGESSCWRAPQGGHVLSSRSRHPVSGPPALDVLRLFASLFAPPNQRLACVIDDLALSPILATRVGALSKGYRRRLLLAIGLLAPQPLLMIDEPFEGLDLRQTRETMRVLRRHATHRTLLLSIHQLGDAERLCHRFVLLSGGNVRGEGNLAELRLRTGAGRVGLEEVFLALT